MFTGIVEEIGRVERITHAEGLTTLTTRSVLVHDGAQIGDSIAVNGVCLTVVSAEGPELTFEAVPETLRLTNLGALRVDSKVDLERAVSAGRPMGGHYVQGHIDDRATLRSTTPDGDAQELWFDVPSRLLPYLVKKGFVAVDGVSLTIVETDELGFSVTLVPHTQDHVVFGRAAPGYVANVEVDVMAKFVERAVAARLAALEARVAELEG